MKSSLYSETTRKIQVDVTPRYLEEQSAPAQSRFVFAYTVTICNHSDKAVQLISRHWIITDGTGHTEQVEGPGVVGQQPKLRPGQTYTYESFCPLSTPTGNMRGVYKLITDSQESFDVQIPLFFLRSDLAVH